MTNAPRIVRARKINASADAVWRVMADLSRHGELIPMTVMDAPARITVPGDVAVAVSSGFLVDSMITTRVGSRGNSPDDGDWVRFAYLRKTGRVLGGTAGIAVRSDGPGRCTALWAEDVTVPALKSLSRFVEPILDVALGGMLILALRRLESAVERTSTTNA